VDYWLLDEATDEMMSNLKLASQISDGLLQQLRDFLDQRADVISGNDPHMLYEPMQPCNYCVF
jgi:hypothetical protein